MLPELNDAAKVQMSLIRPASNDTKHLLPMLLDALQLRIGTAAAPTAHRVYTTYSQ